MQDRFRRVVGLHSAKPSLSSHLHLCYPRAQYTWHRKSLNQTEPFKVSSVPAKTETCFADKITTETIGLRMFFL